ncbi:hypothetical protein D3C81_1907900 [compost metagenome]
MLQRLAAVMQDVRRDNVRMQREADAGQAQSPDLLDHHRTVEKVRPQAAVFFRQVRAEHPRLPGLVPEFAVDMALFLPLRMERHRLFFEEGADAVAKQFVLGAEQGSGDHAAPFFVVGGRWPSETKPPL